MELLTAKLFLNGLFRAIKFAITYGEFDTWLIAELKRRTLEDDQRKLGASNNRNWTI
jgi:hypothetical protein